MGNHPKRNSKEDPDDKSEIVTESLDFLEPILTALVIVKGGQHLLEIGLGGLYLRKIAVQGCIFRGHDFIFFFQTLHLLLIVFFHTADTLVNHINFTVNITV